MGDLIRWLLHDDQKELYDYLFAVVFNLVFLGLAALVLWPMGRAAMALQLAKGYWIFWIVLILASSVLHLILRALRIDLDSHLDAYAITCLAVSAAIQVGWTAFAGLTADDFVAGAPGWIAAVLYVVGFLSCYVASVAVSALYSGGLYRMVNTGIALIGFIVFSVWPAPARVVYNWFF